MIKLNFYGTMLLVILYSLNSIAQVSAEEGIKLPAHFSEFHNIVQNEYSKGYYADKFAERKQIREKISLGLLPESALITDTVFALTLLGQYTNLSGYYSQQDFQAHLYDGPNPTGTVTDYYSEVSYNQLYFTGDAKGWYNMPRTLQEYEGGNNGMGSQGGPRFVWDIIQVADPTLNFADYIQYYDGQGRPHISFLAIVHSGADAAAGAFNIWSHRWNFTVYSGTPYTTNDIDPYSGMNVIIDGPYAIMPELTGGSNTSGSLKEIGVFAHEFGHIFGIPDLYDTDGSSEGLGNWCLMAGGSYGGNGSSAHTPVHMSAWVKKELGWLTPINITSLEEALSIPNVEENPIVYRIWGNGAITDQYYLIENRQKIGFDTNIYDSGFLIFHVDETQSNNRNEDHYLVDLEQADGLRNLNKNQGRGDAGDPFPGSTNNTRFDWNTNPASKDYNLINTFVSVRNIEEDGNIMVGDFNIESGAFLFTEKKTILFELVYEAPPLVKIISISNQGFEDLVINTISLQVGPFTLLNPPVFPVTLATDESVELEIQFNPTTLNFYSENLAFDDNDPIFNGLTLNGQAHIIAPAYTGVLYASTGAVENGKLITVKRNSALSNELGQLNYEGLNSLSIDPITNILYGISSGLTEAELVKVNAIDGDAYTEYVLDIGQIVGIAFDTSGSLYGATLSGEIYTINLTDGSYSFVTTANISLAAITFNPYTNQIWAARKVGIGAKDKIYKIDLNTGEGTLIGQTGFGLVTNDMVFDENGTLYGVIGAPNESGRLISIDTLDGSGTLIGDIGFQNVIGLAYTINGVVNSVNPDNHNNRIPQKFTLDQNYPNPFNPNTQIKFSLPVNSNVKIIIYNLLGEVVRELINKDMNSGTHNIQWNAEDKSGNKVTSGIYLYKLDASGVNGSQFNQVRKMILLK